MAPFVTSERVFDYARACFESGIEDLLDDPSHLLHPWRDEEPTEYFARQRGLAKDLNLDFDEMVARLGSDYERKRLQDIENGVIVPAPREPIPG